MDRADEDDFRDFVATRSAALLRTAYLISGDRGTAEDLLQTALTRAYRHWGRIRRGGRPDAYLRAIMVNERRGRWRRHRDRELLVGTVPEPDRRDVPDGPAALDERDALWRAVLRLPPRTRAVLVLRYWEDLSEAETAEILGCSVGSVKSQASRGLRRLQTELDLGRTDAPVQEGGTR